MKEWRLYRAGSRDVRRDVQEDVLAAIDARARRVGLPRTEYIRRTLPRERGAAAPAAAVEDLAEFANTFADLNLADVVGRAWS